MTNALTVWSEPAGAIVARDVSQPDLIVQEARALASRDQRQIITAFDAGSYEMVAGFVLNKALAQLKRQLASLGMEFVGEMLGRQDLDEDSIPTVAISNFEAIKLARELALVTKTDAKRLSQQIELLAHFDNLDFEDAEVEEMSREEAVSFLKTCVNAILGRDNVAPREFKEFRDALLGRTFKQEDKEVLELKASPYFFKRTTLSVLLSGVKAAVGAQYEHTLGNIVVIVPELWGQFKDQEKWSVGQSYAEAVNGGNSKAVVALKKALLATQGFDYVPETMRSQTFSSAASAVINVHTSPNNFYNEPAAIANLAKLGSTIPWPAFPICMSAILAVALGNRFGHTWNAQADAKKLLGRLSLNQWSYYFNECLSNDQLILSKIGYHEKPRSRWFDLVQEYDLLKIKPKKKRLENLLAYSSERDDDKTEETAARMYSDALDRK